MAKKAKAAAEVVEETAVVEEMATVVPGEDDVTHDLNTDESKLPLEDMTCSEDSDFDVDVEEDSSFSIVETLKTAKEKKKKPPVADDGRKPPVSVMMSAVRKTRGGEEPISKLDYIKVRKICLWENRNGVAPERFKWPLQDGNLHWESGGLHPSSNSGFVTLISDKNGNPKSGKRINEGKSALNSRQMATSVDVGDYISYGYVQSRTEVSINIKGFMFLAQVEHIDRSESFMILKVIYFQNGYIPPRPGNPLIPEKLEYFVQMTFKKLKSYNVTSAVFMNEWGQFIPKRNVGVPEIELDGENLSEITEVKNMDELSQIIKKDSGGRSSIRVYIVVFSFIDDNTMDVLIDKKRYAPAEINRRLIFSNEAYRLRVADNDAFKKHVESNPFFFGGAEDIFDLRCRLEFVAPTTGKDNEFGMIRTFCG